MIRHYTTTNLSAEEVHQTGLKEVARINGEMDRIMQQTGFKGSRAEFFQFLRTDPQFFYKSPEELFEAYKALAKTVDPNLVKVFRTLPREPYGVESIPAAFAPDTTAAYYAREAADGSRAGTFFVNLYKPDARPKWEMMALTLHEAVPGHHLQIALAKEMKDIPAFRRNANTPPSWKAGDCIPSRWATRWDCTTTLIPSSASSHMKCGARCAWS